MMFAKKLYYILISKNPHKTWLKILLFVTLLVFLLFSYRVLFPLLSPFGLGKKEWFNTLVGPVIPDKYLLRRNGDIYDAFYVDMYETVRTPKDRVEQQVDFVIQNTQPSHSASVFLDIGSGTGSTLSSLTTRGYVNVYGIDRSAEMVRRCPAAVASHMVQGDALESMQFEKATFSHILCLGGTLYELDPADRLALFQNAYYWLKHGGYFIVELTDFSLSKTAPASVVNTPEFTYKKALEFGTDNNRITVLETFVDKTSRNVRENEQVLERTDIGSTVNDALYCGFQVTGKTEMVGTSPKQFLYVFQK
jgi:SAM-dependent methyltransferase